MNSLVNQVFNQYGVQILEHNNSDNQVHKYLSSLPDANVFYKLWLNKVEDKFTPSKKELVINKPDKTQANIRLLLKMEKMSKVERVAFVVVKRILVGGLTARLYKKLRDELGLIYAISIGHDSFHGDVRFVTIATQVAKEKVEELIDVVFSEIQKAIKEVDQKEVKKIIPIIEYYESLEVNVNNIVDGVIDSHNYKYEYINSKEFLKLLGKVKASEVKKLMQKIFVKEKLVKVVLK